MDSVKIGIYEKALPEYESYEQMLSAAAEAGFDFFEIAIDNERINRLEDRKQGSLWTSAIVQSGVPILTIVLSIHRYFPLGSKSSATREKAKKLLYQAIEFAQRTGIRIIQLAGYYVFDEAHTEHNRDYFMEGLAQGVAWAGQAGVMLGIENMDGEDVISMTDATRIVSEIQSPWLRLYPDIGNFTANGLDPVTEIKLGANQIVGLHLKDTRLGEFRRVPFGKGKVPFASVFEALKETNYSGPVSLEMWNDNSPQSLKIAAEARLWIKKQMKGDQL